MFHFRSQIGQIFVLFVQFISLGDRLLLYELNAVLAFAQVRINRTINFMSIAVVDALSQLAAVQFGLHRDRQSSLHIAQILAGSIR